MPPTKKRKNDDEDGPNVDETPKKRTKKELRELAMKRAKESMQADKAKVEAVKAKKQQAAAPSKEDAGKIASTPSKRQKAAPKRPSIAKASTPKPAAAAQASAISSTAKKPKSNDVPTPAAAPTAQLQAPGTAPPPMQGMNPAMNGVNPAMMGYGMPPGAAQMNPQGVSQAMMAQFMMGQQQRMMGGGAFMGQQPFGGGFGGQFSPQYAHMNMAPQGQQQQPVQQQPTQAQDVTAQPAKPVVQPQPVQPKPEANVVPPTVNRTITPASPAKKTAIAIPESDDDDDDMPPPPSASLEMQISQQVMANVVAHAKNEPTPFNVPPPEAFAQLSSSQPDDDVEEEVYDDQPIIVDDDEIPPLVQKRRTWGRGLIGAIVVGILSYVIVMWSGDGYEELLSEQSPADLGDPEANCYFDSIVGDSEDYVPACADEPGAPCPNDGVCSGGQLVGCQYWFEEVAEDGKSCGLPAQSQKTLETIIEVLEEKTIEAECSLFSFASRPLFDYAHVQLVRPMELATNPLELAVLEKELVSERKKGKFFIGLPKDHPLELSFACSVASSVKSAIGLIGSLMILLLHSLLSGLWSICKAYPLASIAGLLVVLVVRKRRQHQAYRSKLVRDIANVRQMAYEILQASPSASHVVLHIRDEIAMTMYPDSKTQRQYIIKEVWPRIIPNFVQDNRVRKSTRVMEGKPRDVWQWIAVTSAKKPAAAAPTEQ